VGGADCLLITFFLPCAQAPSQAEQELWDTLTQLQPNVREQLMSWWRCIAIALISS